MFIDLPLGIIVVGNELQCDNKLDPYRNYNWQRNHRTKNFGFFVDFKSPYSDTVLFLDDHEFIDAVTVSILRLSYYSTFYFLELKIKWNYLNLDIITQVWRFNFFFCNTIENYVAFKCFQIKFRDDFMWMQVCCIVMTLYSKFLFRWPFYIVSRLNFKAISFKCKCIKYTGWYNIN